MNSAILMSVAVGASVIVQGGLNKYVSASWGLTGAVLLNAIVFLVIAAFLFYLGKLNPLSVGEFMAPKGSFSQFKLWYLIPGIAGFVIVLGIPFAIQNIGATQTFIWILTAQIIGGFIWDFFVEQKEISKYQVIGGLVCIIGVLVSKIK